MRIAFVTTHPIQYQAPMFRRLAQQPGVDLEVLFCHDHGVRPSFDPQFGRTVQFDVPLLEGYRSRFLPNLVPRASLSRAQLINPDVLSVVRDDSIDAVIVHGYSYVTSLLALAGHTSRRGPKLLLRGESHLRLPRPRWRLAIKQHLLPLALRRVDHFLAIGTLNSEYWQAYGVDPSHITVAPYSVDNDHFRSGACTSDDERMAIRRQFGLPHDHTLFLFCGKLMRIKRPFDPIRALARQSRDAKCSLVLVGTGELEAECHRLVDELGIEDRVYFLGFQNQGTLPKLYSACDALVLPTISETWGLVVNEAMVCGLAIAASDGVGCAPDLIRDDNGATFPVGDVAAIAGIMSRWSADPGLLDSLKEASKRRIANWGLAETVDGIVTGCERALSGGTALRHAAA